MRGETLRLLILFLSMALIEGCQGEIHQTPKQEPAPFWTADEEKEYQDCLPHSIEVWKGRKAGEDYCLVNEEHKRWVYNHPQLAAQKEDKAKMQACLHTNATKINGTRDEFRLAFDRCTEEAYGLQ